MESIKAMRDKARNLEAVIRIGKNGLTAGVVDEIAKMLKKRKLVKVKLLGSCIEGKNKKEIGADIALKCDAVLVQQIGNMVVLCEK